MFRNETRFYALLFEEILTLKLRTFLFSVFILADVTSLNENYRFLCYHSLVLIVKKKGLIM